MAVDGDTSVQAGPSALSVERRLLLERLLAEREGGPDGPVPRSDPDRPVRLSYEQEPLWLLDQTADGQALGNSPIFVRVHGPLDHAAFRDSIAGLVRRHEILRTRCFMAAEGPVQVVLPADDGRARPELMVADLSGMPEADRDRHVAEQALKRFDLASEAPIRAGVFRFGADDHVLLIALHHLASDAHSAAILLRDLAELYESAILGRPAELPALAIQYPDYALWQRQPRTGEHRAKLTEHWLRALSGVSAEPVLRLDRPRPSRRTTPGRFLDAPLPAAAVPPILGLARAERATPFMVLTALFRALLWQESGRPDFLIGTPMSGRARPETQDLIGSFLNILVLRNRIDGGLTVRELVAGERAAALDAFAHQELPHGELAASFAAAHGRTATAPIFQAVFSYEPAEPTPPALAGLRAERYEPPGAVVPHDLMVKAVGGADGISVRWGYDDAVFEEETITRLARRFGELVSAAAGQPELSLAELFGDVPGKASVPQPVSQPEPEPEVAWFLEDDDGPATEWSGTEGLVAGLWEEVLSRQPHDGTQTFFELGGHSLALARLAFRIEEKTGAAVPIAVLLQHPTLPEQAAALDEALRAAPADRDGPVRLPREGVTQRFPASPGQQAQWFLWRYAPRNVSNNVAFCYDLDGPLDAAALGSAVNALIARHEILRTTYVHDTEVGQVVHAQRDRDLPVQQAESRQAALEQAVAAARTPFDLRRASPFRVRLWRYAPQRHLLLTVCQHIAVDEASSRIIEHELSELYRAALEARPPRLAPVALQYADYTVWQNRISRSDRLSYWTGQLANARGTELPADRPRPPVPGAAGAILDVAVPPRVRSALLRLAADLGTTPFTVLLAAFAAFLSQEASTREVVVGTPVAGRHHPAAQGTVGYFLNSLALRIPVDPDAGFPDLVRRTASVLTDAYRNEVPFAEVVRGLDTTTEAGRNPLFEVLFTYVDATAEAPTLPGIAVTRQELPADDVNFDLSVTAVDTDGGLSVFFQYRRDLFEERRVRGWAERLAALLDTVLLGQGTASVRPAAP